MTLTTGKDEARGGSAAIETETDTTMQKEATEKADAIATPRAETRDESQDPTMTANQ